MPENGVRDTRSQCPLQIFMCDDDGIISTGSAFFYACNDDWFFITNWHNVSGRHFLTKEKLSPSGRAPTYIKAKFSKYVSRGDRPEDNKFTVAAQRIDIYNEYNPVWFEHPVLGSSCDVVAIPMSRPTDCPDFMHNAANLIDKTRIPVEPGGTVFIIGFPQSLSVGFGLPIWKSGYIASEPYYPVTINGKLSDIGGMQGGIQLPAFYIDSQTRAGMSGSPVFASYVGAWDTKNPYGPLNFDAPDFWNKDDVILGGKAIEFVGCYSGRIGSKEDEASLGLCWKTEVIETICNSRKLGSHPQIDGGSP